MRRLCAAWACALGMAGAAEVPPRLEVAALARLAQVRAGIEQSLEVDDLAGTHAQDAAFHAGLAGMFELARAPGRSELAPASRSLGRAVVELQAAADSRDRELARARLASVQAAFDRVASFFAEPTRAAAAALARRFTCPMHPDVSGRRGEPCAKCGMALSLPAPIGPPDASAAGGRANTVRAEVHTDQPLSPGREVQAVLKLSTLDGRPVRPADLREVHTVRVHLLIVDDSLTDYHHEHPVESETPGAYRFRFTPREAGRYRAFADVQPLRTGLQEFARADLASAPGVAGRVEKAGSTEAIAEGLRYRLSTESGGWKAGRALGARVAVTDTEGQAFTGLEPVMGAFAHLVGFHENRATVLHVHPMEVLPPRADERGGPELHFRFFVDTPGYYRLFLQVQIGGRSRFVPFGVTVAPAG